MALPTTPQRAGQCERQGNAIKDIKRERIANGIAAAKAEGKGREAARPTKIILTEDKEKLFKMHEEGMKNGTIAAVLGVSRKTVWLTFKKAQPTMFRSPCGTTKPGE